MPDSADSLFPIAPDAPLEWTGQEPDLIVPEWEALGRARLRPEQASRHFLILGESGSGKTRSAVLPLARAALRYGAMPGNGAAPLMVIDPKTELGPELDATNRQEALGRHIVPLEIGGPWTLHAFERKDPRQMDAGEIAARILAFAESFQTEKRDTRQPFFAQAVEGIVTELVGVDLHLFRSGGLPALRGFWDAVGKGIAAQLEGASLRYTPDNYPALHARLCNLAAQKRTVLKVYAETCRSYGVPAEAMLQIATWPVMAEETFSSVVSTLNNALREASADALARHVSLNPFEPPPAERWFRVADAMHNARCVVYRPRNTSAVATTIGRALKAGFFEHTFVRRDKRRPFFYIADEAQRFVTADPVSGEQSYIDRCRAYRAVCILATQSVVSLRYALAQASGDGAQGSEAALEIMMANCGTKLFFRSTDVSTQERLVKLLPAAPVQGRPNVAQVRPASTLRTGGELCPAERWRMAAAHDPHRAASLSRGTGADSRGEAEAIRRSPGARADEHGRGLRRYPGGLARGGGVA